MAVTLIYWRDIPSQITVGKGRRAEKIMLADRFQEAIDMAAMRDKAHETDAYLQGWRKSPQEDGMIAEFADIESFKEKLEAKFDAETLNNLVKNGGYEHGG